MHILFAKIYLIGNHLLIGFVFYFFLFSKNILNGFDILSTPDKKRNYGWSIRCAQHRIQHLFDLCSDSLYFMTERWIEIAVLTEEPVCCRQIPIACKYAFLS